MGEVYRARDTRLDRTVTIKVLTNRLADHAQLRERFEREARAISSLFEGEYQMLATSTPDYDVSPDGQRFLMLKPVEQAAQINVVQNWFEELKQRVPAGKP